MQSSLTEGEKANLKKHKLPIRQLLHGASDGVAAYLDVTTERVRELRALAEFQTVSSIGVKFA